MCQFAHNLSLSVSLVMFGILVDNSAQCQIPHFAWIWQFMIAVGQYHTQMRNLSLTQLCQSHKDLTVSKENLACGKLDRFFFPKKIEPSQ
jgi:hypothetical protein